jgi:hypothetical protein
MEPQSTPRGTRTKEDMFGLIAKHDTSNTTVKEFCQEHGLTQGMFYYWQKKYYAKSNGSDVDSPVGFARLQVEDRQPGLSEQGLFAEVRGIKLYQAVPAAYLNELASARVC